MESGKRKAARAYFGTDGVRGEYGSPVVNESLVAALGFAAAQWAKAAKSGQPFALIGRDTRASGPALTAAVAAGLKAGGLEPRSLGILPTPALARAVRLERAALGVMITASHNPAADNGVKFFKHGGVKLTDPEEEAIEALLPSSGSGSRQGFRETLSAFDDADEPPSEYIDATAALLPPGSLSGWKIVVDTANGATCGTTPVVLRRMGADVTALGDSPDGRNINSGVGSEHPALLAARVKSVGARIGIAHDGDGDRCILCDETGGILDGDEMLTILAMDALARGDLAAKTLVVTNQSNLGVDAAIASAGGRVVRTPVGDRYVAEAMVATGAALGGESSGHIICADFSPTGDGLVAAIRVIAVMRSTGKPLSKLRSCLKKFPQKAAALTVRSKKPLETLTRIAAAVAEVERRLGTKGRAYVRYSGTEPKLRLLVEGPTEALVAEGLREIESAARADLDVV